MFRIAARRLSSISSSTSSLTRSAQSSSAAAIYRSPFSGTASDCSSADSVPGSFQDSSLCFHFHIPRRGTEAQVPNHLKRFFSAVSGNGHDGNNTRRPQSTSDAWNLTPDNEDLGVFGSYDGDLQGIPDEHLSVDPDRGGSSNKDVFQGSDEDVWAAAVGVEGGTEFKSWTVGGDEKVEDLFSLQEDETRASTGSFEGSSPQTDKESLDLVALLKEEHALTSVLKGPNRAFGDLLAASGISDAMLDSLMALKDFDGIEGLPPLTEIEDMRYQKSLKNSSRAEMERLKQEEIAKSRVRTVDEKGRAYGTGRRKCSIARVWVEPGDGKFVVNDKEFDVYFPMLDHRAALLRPFSETKTLGLWDVKCTVKGGGVSGQVGAIRLGVSRALQNWEPGLRPPLREAGFLTRDSRVVERKKPGKAKARKSFQWVKR